MTPSTGRRLRRMFDWGNRRLDLGSPAARITLALFTLAVLAALGAAAWMAYVDARRVTGTVMDLRQAYVLDVQAKIQGAADAAQAARGQGAAPGRLKVRILVNRQGRLVSATLVESSGDPELDALALRVVRESAPFERFSDRMRRSTRHVEVLSTFIFR